MVIDDSFKRAGAVPFLWEIEPGVPKLVHQNQPSSTGPLAPALTPPPAGAGNNSTGGETASRFRSKSVRTRTNRDRLDWSSSKEVSNGLPGCFSPMLTRRSEKKRNEEAEETEVDYSSDSETLSRCSTSTGKTISSSHDSVSSPSSSSSISSCFGSSTSFSSIRSSPQMAESDAMGSWRIILEKWKI